MIRRLHTLAALVILVGLAACNSASYQVMKKGTYKPGASLSTQSPEILQSSVAQAPGGTTSVIVVYFGGETAPLVEAKGDSSALVQATAAVGRSAFDIAVKLAKASAGGL